MLDISYFTGVHYDEVLLRLLYESCLYDQEPYIMKFSFASMIIHCSYMYACDILKFSFILCNDILIRPKRWRSALERSPHQAEGRVFKSHPRQT